MNGTTTRLCGHERPEFGCQACINRRDGYSLAADMGVVRTNLSLPCTVPVVPGTPDTDAPIAERTETCNVDAFWFAGLAAICDLHLVDLLGTEDEYRAGLRDWEREGWSMEQERERHPTPWAERYRYPQNRKLLPDKHPLADSPKENDADG